MAWVVTVLLDDDKKTSGAEVGTIAGTFTDGSAFVVPFAFSVRTEFKGSAQAGIKAAFVAALAAETTKRTRQSSLETALTTALNT